MEIGRHLKCCIIFIIAFLVMLAFWYNEYFYFQTPQKYRLSPNEENIIENDFFDDETTDHLDLKKSTNEDLRLPDYCERVIVLTTINEPTANVKYMSDALYGWCLLVVGDKKTPENWQYKNAFYLGVREQTILAETFSIVEMIPYNSYSRKMIGYLYAIKNGAKYIYETDDDNAPFDGLFGFRYANLKGLVSNFVECDEKETKFINPYAYFGQPSMWPRGYPLEKISSQKKCSLKMYRKLTYKIYSGQVPLIQQGLVNGDPDVDAIYRVNSHLNSN